MDTTERAKTPVELVGEAVRTVDHLLAVTNEAMSNDKPLWHHMSTVSLQRQLREVLDNLLAVRATL